MDGNKAFDFVGLLWGIDAGRGVGGGEDADVGSVFKGSKLFEGFGKLQGGWLPGDEGFQEIAAVSIDALVAKDGQAGDWISEKR